MDVSTPCRSVSSLFFSSPILTYRCSLRPVFHLAGTPLPGFDRGRRLDLAIVPRKIPFSLISTIPHDTPAFPRNIPDEYAVLACVQHTVSTGKRRFRHNRDHAYAKLNQLLKCPLNLCFLVLGIHGIDMAIWYGDRNGIIEVELATNGAYILAALLGLANIPFTRPLRRYLPVTSHPCL
jgi:hypothetical protein